MRRILLLFYLLFSSLLAFAQQQQLLLDYQAIARQATGEALNSEWLTVRVEFTAENEEGEVYYAEQHRVQTDNNGYFNLKLGAGTAQSGSFSDIPWAEQTIWVNTTLETDNPTQGVIRNRQTLLSVPYAFYAQSAGALIPEPEVETRNHSVYWLTGGNRDTRPPIHFIGNRDSTDLVIKTVGQEVMRIENDGQVRVLGRVQGNDSNKGNYPLTIKGKRQGIWIYINEDRSSKNNFVTFEDAAGIQGRIEGQTVAELLLDPFFLIQQAANIAEGTKLVASLVTKIGEGGADIAAGTASIASLFFAWSAPGWFTAAAGQFFATGPVVVESAALLTNVIRTTQVQIRDIGVQYSSGSEDYAEYLERFAVEQDMEPGEIVAVVGGKLTRNTQGAGMLKVVSFAPAVVGNMPQPQVADMYEKVAFLGQVNVRITGGAKVGDYIIPSGKNDGLGVAVAPESMTTEQYGQIVGVAWETVAEQPLQMVKIGVGMNRNELAPKVAELSQRVDNIVNYLEGKGPLHPEKEFSEYLVGPQTTTSLGKLWTDEEFDRMVEERADELEQIYQQMAVEMPERFKYMQQIPGFEDFMADPVQGLKNLRREPSLASYWAQMDRLVQKQSENNNN